MLEDKDIQKLKKELATKQDLEKFSVRAFDVFVTKDDLKEAVSNLATKEDLINLQSSIDAYAKKADTYFQEMVMLSHQVKRNEQWIRQIADKLDLKLEY